VRQYLIHQGSDTAGVAALRAGRAERKIDVPNIQSSDDFPNGLPHGGLCAELMYWPQH
jgi:hypothetical protein